MKHVIIGTAGHVDHGKTALVKALTGIDTDRLEEEKRRGVTIELGFAYIDFEDGTRAGVIDVPGHERFIRNMLAGAGGIDLAMLVVAADEGVMPQTREHLGILTQLGINSGLVAVTKTDKIGQDWLELVIEEIEQRVQGTFLEGKPVLPVSAFTGDGIPELRRTLNELVNAAGEKDSRLPFRLPVDRVFPIDGFGIVVTGTLIEGSVKNGDTAEILPSGEKAPVRSIQVHGESVEKAYAGQRTAISLTGVKRGKIRRGDVVAAKGTLNVTNTADVRLSVLSDCKHTVKTGAELHLYHGTRTMLAKVVLMDQNELRNSDSCYARLKFKEPLPCKRSDRFVIRFYSPLETIGGGVILDSMPGKRIKRDNAARNALEIREMGGAADIAGLAAAELGGVFTEAELSRRADLDERACLEAIGTLVNAGNILQLMPGKYISAVTLETLSEKCVDILSSYHAEYPLRAGMNIAELRQKLLPDGDITRASAAINALEAKGTLVLSEKNAALPGFTVDRSPAQSEIHGKLLEIFTDAGYEPPASDMLASMFAKGEKNEFEHVLESMTSSGELIMLSTHIFWLRSVYDKAAGLIRTHFEKEDEITLAQCRDMLGTSRKYALAFLEYLDRIQATRKQGDSRKLARGL